MFRAHYQQLVLQESWNWFIYVPQAFDVLRKMFDVQKFNPDPCQKCEHDLCVRILSLLNCFWDSSAAQLLIEIYEEYHLGHFERSEELLVQYFQPLKIFETKKKSIDWYFFHLFEIDQYLSDHDIKPSEWFWEMDLFQGLQEQLGEKLYLVKNELGQGFVDECLWELVNFSTKEDAEIIHKAIRSHLSGDKNVETECWESFLQPIPEVTSMDGLQVVRTLFCIFDFEAVPRQKIIQHYSLPEDVQDVEDIVSPYPPSTWSSAVYNSFECISKTLSDKYNIYFPELDNEVDNGPELKKASEQFMSLQKMHDDGHANVRDVLEMETPTGVLANMRRIHFLRMVFGENVNTFVRMRNDCREYQHIDRLIKKYKNDILLVEGNDSTDEMILDDFIQILNE